MDAKELMIDDWVFDKEDIDNTNPMVITGVINDDIYVDGVIADIKDIKPIPLTKEILEKNGIKYQWGKLWYQGGFDGVFELRYSNSQDIAFGDTPTVIQIPISYVHQLQHALRLCGFDKEITL